MKIVEVIDVVSAGPVASSTEWQDSWSHVKQAIELTDWPHGTGSFVIRPATHENGVGPIKVPCLRELDRLMWRTEKLPRELAGVGMGNLDALCETPTGIIGFEWETGNISSSHRAIGKLIQCMQMGGIVGGFLVVPGNGLKKYLTDRIGNIGELRSYIPMWSRSPVERGVLRFVVVEHDSTSEAVALIPKDYSGRASQGGAVRKGVRPAKKRRPGQSST